MGELIIILLLVLFVDNATALGAARLLDAVRHFCDV